MKKLLSFMFVLGFSPVSAFGAEEEAKKLLEYPSVSPPSVDVNPLESCRQEIEDSLRSIGRSDADNLSTTILDEWKSPIVHKAHSVFPIVIVARKQNDRKFLQLIYKDREERVADINVEPTDLALSWDSTKFFYSKDPLIHYIGNHDITTFRIKRIPRCSLRWKRWVEDASEKIEFKVKVAAELELEFEFNYKGGISKITVHKKKG